MNDKRLISIIAIGVIILCAVYLYINLERVTEEITTEQSDKARRNPFLAAERFLVNSEHNVESVTGRRLLNQLPDIEDTMIINNFFATMTPDQEENLLAWIEHGGHLIVTPRQSLEETEEQGGFGFFEQLGIHKHGSTPFTFGLNVLEDLLNNQETFDYPGVPESLTTEFHKGEWLHSEWKPDFFVLTDKSSDREDEKLAYHLLQLNIGQGLLTVTSDNSFLTNRQIGNLDHAWLLSLLAQHRQGKIWLLYDKNMPSLWNILMNNAFAVILSLAIMLILAIWLFMQRSGPVLDLRETTRRNLIEHLDAKSRYLWRSGNRNILTTTTQKQILEHWYLQHPFLRNMQQQQQMEWISQHSGHEQSDIEVALFSNTTNVDTLIKQTRILQLLRLRIYRA